MISCLSKFFDVEFANLLIQFKLFPLHFPRLTFQILIIIKPKKMKILSDGWRIFFKKSKILLSDECISFHFLDFKYRRENDLFLFRCFFWYLFYGNFISLRSRKLLYLKVLNTKGIATDLSTHFKNNNLLVVYCFLYLVSLINWKMIIGHYPTSIQNPTNPYFNPYP